MESSDTDAVLRTGPRLFLRAVVRTAKNFRRLIAWGPRPASFPTGPCAPLPRMNHG